jgi:hypothetical protein
MKRSRIALGALLFASLHACGPSERLVTPPLGRGGPGGGGDEIIPSEGPEGPPSADAGGLCGNQIHKLIFDAPNIYFVLDTSGSMAAPAGNSGTRYQLVRKAALGMIQRLGPLINVGAALFPLGATEAEPCRSGGQVLPMSPGDPVTSKLGPTGVAFSKATQVAPFGGTPTAATLRALLPTLTSLGERTIVVLATDGGPNCNEGATCSADACMTNIEGQCAASTNCCAPNGPDGPAMCVDREATSSAVAAIAGASVPVYVVGIPGSEIYGSVLGELSLAGGAPQLAPPFYYKVTDLDTLGSVLGTIAAGKVSCAFDLVDPPEAPGFTNVYFDETVLPSDEADGWRWVTPSSIEIVGEACQKLKSGGVSQVQIVSGCPTEAPR